MQARVQGKDLTQGFNQLQMSPNWFLGIQTLDPPHKVGLSWTLVVAILSYVGVNQLVGSQVWVYVDELT